MRVIKGVLIIIIFLIGGVMLAKDKAFSKERVEKPKRILLLGASVGQAWKLEEWPQRMQINKYIFESIAVYQFDKTEALNEILMRPKRKFRLTKTYIRSFLMPVSPKPDVIIIKECSGYFPNDLEKYESLITQWVAQCKAAGIKPIITTVVPITEELAKRIPGKLDAIIVYNDWVKEYTLKTGIGCLDLEAYLILEKLTQ